MSERKPFHESIIDVLNNYKARPGDEYLLLNFLGKLLRATKIPKGHNDLIAAWQGFIRRNWGYFDDFWGVVDVLIEQRQEAEAKKAAKQKKEHQEAPHISEKSEGG
jgi:hypothetical protein